MAECILLQVPFQPMHQVFFLLKSTSNYQITNSDGKGTSILITETGGVSAPYIA